MNSANRVLILSINHQQALPHFLIDMALDIEDLQAFQDLLEDTISYYCDEYDMSAQLAYVLANDYITGKINKLKKLQDMYNE